MIVQTNEEECDKKLVISGKVDDLKLQTGGLIGSSDSESDQITGL